MGSLILWINAQREQAELPAPIIAAIAHYQFATIHPYYDGNGRTARLLTNLVLHLAGYGLKGIYSLEEYYAQNLQGYYDALTVGPSHNYYLGRAEADISKWILFFCEGMAVAFAKVRLSVDEASSQHGVLIDQRKLLRRLDERQKRILPLFREYPTVSARQMATLLGVTPRTVRTWCALWLEDDFLLQEDSSNKTRAYRLADEWRELIR